MKHHAGSNKNVVSSILGICLLLLISSCIQLEAKSPYVGTYELENDPAIAFYIFERDGKLYERNVWGMGELNVNDDHSYVINAWGVTGDFSQMKQSQFQTIILQYQEKESRYNRIEQQPSLAFLYSINPTFTNFSHPDQQACIDDYPLHSLTENSENPEEIERLIRNIQSDHLSWGLQDSLLIYKDNKLLVEEYFDGWKRNDPHQIQSVSKSLTSLLVGSLITEGKLDSADKPLGDYLPQYQYLLTGEKSKITLTNLLNMSAGLEWNEWTVAYSNPKNTRYAEMESDDSVAFTLQRPLTHEPGRHFSYSGGYVSVVGAVVETAAKKSTAATYAQDSLSKHLCFKNAYWSKQNDGKTNTAGGAMMRPMDMLKIGQLMLDDGVWQGKQIIGKQWIRDSMDRTHNPYSYAQYGYLWWYGSYIDAAGKIYSGVLARGWGGQEIAIIKELDLVVVNTASSYEMESKLDEMIHNFILPAFLNEKD